MSDQGKGKKNPPRLLVLLRGGHGDCAEESAAAQPVRQGDDLLFRRRRGIDRHDIEDRFILPLRVSVITTTRAYAKLVAGRLVANVPGKGYFVLPRNAELVREQVLREVETHFANGVAVARLANVDDDEIRSILKLAVDRKSVGRERV